MSYVTRGTKCCPGVLFRVYVVSVAESQQEQHNYSIKRFNLQENSEELRKKQPLKPAVFGRFAWDKACRMSELKKRLTFSERYGILKHMLLVGGHMHKRDWGIAKG